MCLATDNLRLAEIAATKMAKRIGWRHFDELHSAALLGLVDAARRFDPARGCSFRTFAANRMRGEMIDAMRAMAPKGFRRRAAEAPKIGSIYATMATDADSGRRLTMADELADAAGDIGADLEAIEEVHRLTRGLPSRTRQAIELYFTRADMATVKAVGDALGVCESRVSQIIQRGLLALRDMRAAETA